MTTARAIIRDALTFGLNRLSPGEAEDADLFNRCLDALNSIADAMNGQRTFLFRELLTSSGGSISTATATLGTDWATITPGTEIIGAYYVSGSLDEPIDKITFGQYADAPDKTSSGVPQFFAHDGLSTLYFYPVPASYTIKLRTKQPVSEFADLATEYTMPAGYKSALSDLLADLMAATLAPGMVARAAQRAYAARSRLRARACEPAIIAPTGSDYDINQGW